MKKKKKKKKRKKKDKKITKQKTLSWLCLFKSYNLLWQLSCDDIPNSNAQINKD